LNLILKYIEMLNLACLKICTYILLWKTKIENFKLTKKSKDLTKIYKMVYFNLEIKIKEILNFVNKEE